MGRAIIKGVVGAFSLTLMLLAIVYTAQTRETRAHEPTRIGEEVAQKSFLVEYADTRKELMMGFLRERFPQLNLPEPDAPPPNPLSLQALRERTLQTQSALR